MDKEILINYYHKRNYSKEVTEAAIKAVEILEKHLAKKNKMLENITVDEMSDYITILIERKENTEENMRAMARYYYLIGANEIYIYFTALLGSRGVLESIHHRINEYEDKYTAEKIFGDIEIPPLGTPLKEMPRPVCSLVNNMAACLPRGRYRKILAGNNHGIPLESFITEKKYYEEAQSLDQYLADLHERKIAELQQFCDEKKIWFEQVITQEVVDFVRSNQEILSAVHNDDKLYITKIPYDTVNFLQASDQAMKNYFLCHCPFVRTSFLNTSETVPPDWCYCSAGFEKLLFEVIFAMELDIELLESPLLGHNRCRFAIDLPVPGTGTRYQKWKN